MSRRLQNTIWIDLDTARAGLTFPNIEKPQLSCFRKFQCIRNERHNLTFCPGPPQNTLIIFFDISKRSFSNEFTKIKNGIWNFENLNLEKNILAYWRKLIKVFCGGPGQNGRFWGPCLAHWHSQKHGYWGFSLLGKVNPASAVSRCVRMVF